MAKPIQLTDNVVATFQDREAVALYVVEQHAPLGDASLTVSDLATLDELEVHAGTVAEMLALFVSKIEAAHDAATCERCGYKDFTGETVTPESKDGGDVVLLCTACQDAA